MGYITHSLQAWCFDLTNIQTGNLWSFYYEYDTFPGNPYDDVITLVNRTAGGSYVDRYDPYHWTKTTVVPVPGALFLFLSALAALGITSSSRGRKKHTA